MEIPVPSSRFEPSSEHPPAGVLAPTVAGRSRTGRPLRVLLISCGALLVVGVALVAASVIFGLNPGLVALVTVGVVVGATTFLTPLLPQGLPGLALARRVSGILLWVDVLAIAYLYVYPQLGR